MSGSYEKIMLWPSDEEGVLYRKKETDLPPRPAMLVVPGGGYGMVCLDTEGFPVAARFEALGFRVFLLEYRCAPHRFPAPQQDIFRAIRLIRRHAAEWGVIKENLALCGFSAGGHLVASAGTLFDRVSALAKDDADAEEQRPDALVLAYPVITAGEFAHAGSLQNLLGEKYDAEKETLSLELQVREKSVPAFLWHTLSDEIVPYQNSLLFAGALTRAGVPAEVHLYPSGPHGMALGYGREDISHWPELVKSFLRGTLGFRFPGERKKRTVVLTFDDACRSQWTNVLPVLRKYGFHATFFICRFSEKWREEHGSALMTQSEVRQLFEEGHDIGNHTWSHLCQGELSEAEIAEEFDRMESWLREAGLPPTVSYAYPGGPFAANAVPVLKAKGVRYARTTEHGPWNRTTDPMRIPSYSLQQGNDLTFYQALALADNDPAPVLLYHGVPDTVHPWVNTEPEHFAAQMKYLFDNGYEVISMREYGERLR